MSASCWRHLPPVGTCCSKTFPVRERPPWQKRWRARWRRTFSGVSVFNQRDQSFEFHEGPVFTNILLADEINRASPRTQSALLESMAEGQVSLDGVRRPLDALFLWWRLKIRLSSRVPIRCPKHRWIVSRCDSVLVMSPPMTRWLFSPTRSPPIRWTQSTPVFR